MDNKLQPTSNEKESALTVIQPVMDLKQIQSQKNQVLSVVKKMMTNGKDFGVIPGTSTKSLWQPGAEKLAKFFGLVPKYECLTAVEDFEKGFVYYKYKCTLIHYQDDKFAGEAERSCNSKEKKYKFKEIGDLVNTCQAMAQKRALVAAVRQATMATEIFDDTLDPEDTTQEAPAVNEQDARRNSLMARLFAAASERGFSADQVDKTVEKKFNVDSMTKLQNHQIEEAYESLIQKFKPVGKGNKPEPYGPPPEDPTIKAAEQIFVEGETVEDDPSKPIENEEKIDLDEIPI